MGREYTACRLRAKRYFAIVSQTKAARVRGQTLAGTTRQHTQREMSDVWLRLGYSANNAIRDVKERANLGLVSPMADDKACPTLGLASRPGFSTLPPAEVDLCDLNETWGGPA